MSYTVHTTSWSWEAQLWSCLYYAAEQYVGRMLCYRHIDCPENASGECMSWLCTLIFMISYQSWSSPKWTARWIFFVQSWMKKCAIKRVIAHVNYFFRSNVPYLFCQALGGYQSSASAFETADCQRTFRLILKNTEDCSDWYLVWWRLFRLILSVLAKAM